MFLARKILRLKKKKLMNSNERDRLQMNMSHSNKNIKKIYIIFDCKSFAFICMHNAEEDPRKKSPEIKAFQFWKNFVLTEFFEGISLN